MFKLPSLERSYTITSRVTRSCLDICQFFSLSCLFCLIILWRLKYKAMPIANLSCSGISPGKSHFPLQSGQGVREVGPINLCSHVPQVGRILPRSNQIGLMTTAADLPRALGLADVPQWQVLDLNLTQMYLLSITNSDTGLPLQLSKPEHGRSSNSKPTLEETPYLCW